MSAQHLTQRKLTAPLLGAIAAALDAALAGDGFKGGDFDGLDRVYFQRASDWATIERMRRKARKDRRTKKARQAEALFCKHLNWVWAEHGRTCPDCGGIVVDPGD